MAHDRSYLPVFSDTQKRNQRNLIMLIMRLGGYRQSSLAKRLGVSRSLVTRWLSGTARITPRSALRLQEIVPEVSTSQLCPHIYDEVR